MSHLNLDRPSAEAFNIFSKTNGTWLQLWCCLSRESTKHPQKPSPPTTIDWVGSKSLLVILILRYLSPVGPSIPRPSTALLDVTISASPCLCSCQSTTIFIGIERGRLCLFKPLRNATPGGIWHTPSKYDSLTRAHRHCFNIPQFAQVLSLEKFPQGRPDRKKHRGRTDSECAKPDLCESFANCRAALVRSKDCSIGPKHTQHI